MKIKTRRYYIYYLSRILFFLVSLIPLEVSLKLAGFLGRKTFRYLEKYRNIALDNIKRHYDRGDEQNYRTVEKVFVNLAKNGAEWMKFASWKAPYVKALVPEAYGFENLDEALSHGKGAIVLTGHFGNWELMMSYVRSRGYSGAVVGRRLYFKKYDDFIVDLRKKTGDKVIYRDESPKKILKVLKDGEIIGMLADQDINSIDGVFVDFFGEKAYTPVAPVRLAMASGAPIVPAFIIRRPDDKHKLIIDKPIYMSRDGVTDETVKKYTQTWTDILEKYVKEYPDQWAWIHRRWKTKE